MRVQNNLVRTLTDKQLNLGDGYSINVAVTAISDMLKCTPLKCCFSPNTKIHILWFNLDVVQVGQVSITLCGEANQMLLAALQ